MTVLIVGGAGYIGSHVNKAFHEQGKKTVVLDNLSRGFAPAVKWGELVTGDVGDRTVLEHIFTKYQIESVIHLSSFAYVGESVDKPLMYYQNNVCNTLALFQTMLDHNVKDIVFSSTCATFGHALRLPIDEDHPQNPINPYGHTKLMVEHVLRDCAHAYGLSSCVLRYFNAAGCDPQLEIGENHDPETHLIPICLQVASGQRDVLQIFGNDYDTKDGTCVRDYIHVTDLASAHFLASEFIKQHRGFHHFNLGNGEGFSVLEIVKKVEELTGRAVPTKFAPRRAGDPAILVGASKKAFEQLGWKPRYHSLDDIIGTAWKWHTR